MLSRDEALKLIREHVSRKNVIYHMIAVESIMRSLGRFLSENEELWGLTGLLHDIDYEKVGEDWEKHGLLAENILNGNVPDEVTKAIKTHNYEHTGVMPEARMEKALIACDAISGLLVACALVMPSKKLADVKTKTVRKKFKAKDFAKGVDRKRILVCEEIGIPRDKFFEIALNGLKSAAADIGL